jgi:glucose-1-phosphate thymidylyltransferase
VEDIARVCGEELQEVVYITGRFGDAAEQELLRVAESLGASGRVCYQDEALGTAHAILCAGDSLKGNVTIAFADTLFKASFVPDRSADGVLWVQRIENPEQFGVLKLNDSGEITDFVEKPKTFVSDLAMIGIYSFKSGEALREELQFLIDNDIRNGGEYQLPDALRNMMKKGMKFAVGKVDDWMDCGNMDATVDTNKKVLSYENIQSGYSFGKGLQNSHIVEPCYIGSDCNIEGSIIGPYVSLGSGSVITNSILRNCLIQSEAKISNALLENTMLGKAVVIEGRPDKLSLGDYSTFHE